MLNALSKAPAPKKEPKEEPEMLDFSSVPYTGRCKGVSFSARVSLVKRLEEIRDIHNIKSLNQVLLYALRFFVLKYDAGESGMEQFVVSPAQPKSSLAMDDEPSRG